MKEKEMQDREPEKIIPVIKDNHVKELTDEGGDVVGLDVYFSSLNSSQGIDCLLMNSASINYYDDIKRWCSSVKTELSRIYDDLQENAPYLRSIEASYRNNVQFLVNGLNEFLKKFDGSGSSYADKCISYITLYDSSTKYQGNGSKSDVSKGVSTLKSGVSGLSMSSGDRMKLMEKAAKSSPQNAAGSDPKKQIFLSNITSGFKYNSKFLGDVLADYYAVYEQSGKIRGENGKDIGSSDYIKSHETKAFGSNVCSDIVSSKQYVANILKALDNIGKTISTVMEQLKSQPYYIHGEHMAKMELAKDNLEKCGAKVSFTKPTNIDREERIELYTMILSEEQTKTLADNMRGLTGNPANGIEIGAGIALEILLFCLKIPAMGMPLLATSTSAFTRTSTSNEEVLHAARFGKKIKMVVTDSKYNHTSASIYIEYIIVE